MVSGIREDVGYDFKNYISFYLFNSAPEFGFNLVNKGLKTLGFNYHAMFFLYSLVTIVLVCKGIEQYTSHAKIAFLLYILIPGLYLNSFSIVRQSVAIAILFYGYRFLHNKKIGRYIIVALTATSFHYSSLFSIPFFLLSLWAKNIKKWMYFVILIVGILLSRVNIIAIIFTSLLGSSHYLAYATYNDGGASFAKILVLNGFAVVLLLFFNKKADDKIKMMYFFTILSVVIVTMFGSVGAVTRFSYYFKIFEIALVANIIYYFKNKDARLFIILFIIVGYYGFMFYNALAVDLKLDYFPKMTPYRTFLMK
jgi:hypothetical protein